MTKKNSFIPVMISIEEKNILVVGAGKAAMKKVKTMKGRGANITIVGSDVSTFENEKSADFETINENEVKVINENYNEKHLNDKHLVFIATNNEELNEKIQKDCEARNILVNRVDTGFAGDFINMYNLEDEEYNVGISTYGASPHLLKSIKKDIKNIMDTKYKEKISLLRKFRDINREESKDAEFRQMSNVELSRKEIEELKRMLKDYEINSRK